MSVKAAKPCVLQVNNSGAWKNVLRFDAANTDQVSKVEQGAELLHEACPRITFRMATDDGTQTVLFRLSEGQWSKS